MSANNVIFIKKEKGRWDVYYQGCADLDGLGNLEKTFTSLEKATTYAQGIIDELGVEYGIRFIK